MLPLLAAAILTASAATASTGCVSVTNNSSVTTSDSYSSATVENVSSGSGGTTVHVEQNDNGKTNSYTVTVPAGESVDFSTTTDTGQTQVHIQASAHSGSVASERAHEAASTSVSAQVDSNSSANIQPGSSPKVGSPTHITASFVSNIGFSFSSFFSHLIKLFGF